MKEDSKEKPLMYERFQTLLKEHNEKPADVSRATGVEKSTLSQWKSGTSIPKVDKMKKIAEHYGVTVDWLRGEPNAPKYELNVSSEGSGISRLTASESMEILPFHINNIIEELRLNPTMSVNGKVLNSTNHKLLLSTLEYTGNVIRTICETESE